MERFIQSRFLTILKDTYQTVSITRGIQTLKHGKANHLLKLNMHITNRTVLRYMQPTYGMTTPTIGFVTQKQNMILTIKTEEFYL